MNDCRGVALGNRQTDRRDGESARRDSRGPFRSDMGYEATEPGALFDDLEKSCGCDRSNPGSGPVYVLVEVRQCDGQPSPHGPLGYAQCPSDLGVGMALEISQGKDLLILGAHLAYSILHGVALKGRDQAAPDTLGDILRALIRYEESPRAAVTPEPTAGIDEEMAPAFSARDKTSVRWRSHGAQSLLPGGLIRAATKRKRSQGCHGGQISFPESTFQRTRNA